MDFKKYLNENFVVFDGAMGTMLQNSGLKLGDIPEIYNITHPKIIRNIHKRYIEAGADVVTTNTFQANELKLGECPYSLEEVIESGVKLAKESGAKWVALDIGPLGQLMEPMGTISFGRAYEIFKRQIVAGVKAGADIILIETISDLYEAKAAVLAAKENSSLPILCTMTFQEDGRTFIGNDPKTAIITLQGLGIDGFGINCSLGPKEIIPLVNEILQYSKVPVMIQPNAGLPQIKDECTIYDISPSEFANNMKIMVENGVRILGGCCGTSPEFIMKISNIVHGVKIIKTHPKGVTAVTSGNKTVILDGKKTIIGERINPTGKKKLKEALKSRNMEYILNEAINQTNAGADILDINVGLPEINEVEVIKNVIYEVQSIINLPLQIDSASSSAIEAAVRIYNGKPIINSVNGKEEVMDSIFPIVKKYGASIIGLTLDKNGIPSSAEERFRIAERIVKRAKEFGIPREDILIDCLVLTASAQQCEVIETLKAIKLVKEKLKVKTVLGISNVSFGLPERELLNSTFLAAAFGAGLDAPILNPMSKEIMNTVNAFKVLYNEDKDAKRFIENYGDTKANREEKVKVNKDLKDIIIEGRKEEAALITKELLKEKNPMEIINEYFVPALDVVGEKFDKGKIFLPQLLKSAETVKSAFKIIKELEIYSNDKKVSKGKIILATVKGDIHDIGKNIVKMMLENYGFDIIDLGKDVPIEEVVRVAKEKNIKLVGLSALMTTTVKNMEKTIRALRDEKINCKVMVGGAVLTKEYAEMIGADYYAKDARESVKIANMFF
ncbi:homocysteine S-methyltransferase family protein [Clostridium sediminicola]|uniref:homocysteine S-methyltransferase family protein n=1 Tax=Clostridium sediminicola TaxID=3114879 RepID=UPI0031F1FE7A